MDYYVKVRARDISGGWSGWSPSTVMHIHSQHACPTLFVWNGADYSDEGVLNIHAESDVTVQHEISGPFMPTKHLYNLQLRELDQFTSHIDQIKLYALDFSGKSEQCPLVSAKLGNKPLTGRLLLDDERRVDLTPDQIINVEFLQTVPYRETKSFVFEINGYNSKVP